MIGAAVKALGALPSGVQWAMGGAFAVLALALALSVNLVLSQAEDLGKLRSSLATATAAARENAAALDAARAQAARDVAAVASDRDTLARRLASVAQMRKEIAYAPASDDGPVAPVLARALGRLRLPAAGGGPGDPGGEGEPAGSASDVRR